jgi:hypothetical protein
VKRWQGVLARIGAVGALLTPALAAPPAAAAGPCVVSAYDGSCGPYRTSKITLSNGYNTYVSNNGWNCASKTCGPQTVTAYDPSNWSVVSQQVSGNIAVLTYPNVQQLFTQSNGQGRALTSFSTVRSYYAEASPHNRGTKAQAAYDVWLDDTTGSNEVMIWVDDVNRGAGGAHRLAQATFSHVAYTLYQYGGPRGELIWLRSGNARHGTVHILAMLRWLVNHNYESTTATIGQVQFGWEIASTGGVPETFTVTDYSLTTRDA